MKTSTRARIAAVALVAATATACDTGTAPDVGPEFDAEAALEDYQALEAAMASAEMPRFQALAGRTPFGSSPAAIDAMATLPSASLDDGGRAFAFDLAKGLREAASAGPEGPALGPIISGWHRGTTFVYDPEEDDYTPDLTREGAPETGVRFILYDVDGSGTPVVEEEIGYADLVDEGDGSAEDIVLRLSVVVEEQPVLDYRTTLDHDATSGALTVDGFLAGDEARLDFDISMAVSDVDGVEQGQLDFEIGVEAREFSIVGQVRGMEENDDGSGSVELEVRHGPHMLGVDMTGEDGILDGTIFVNGEAFATVTGPEDDPVIADPEGGPLTVSELRVLRRVVDVVEDVFDFLEDILDPVDELVLLGFIL